MLLNCKLSVNYNLLVLSSDLLESNTSSSLSFRLGKARLLFDTVIRHCRSLPLNHKAIWRSILSLPALPSAKLRF